MARKVMLLFVSSYAAVLGVLAISLYNASPGPASQAILGVGIGRYDRSGGIVYLSGRYLHCDPSQTTGAATCRMELAGRTLEIRAQRNSPEHPSELGGTCEAFYAGKPWPCRIDSRHVHVAWFAYLDEPLGLDDDQLAALRQQYFLENLPESSFLNGIGLVSFTTAVLAVTIVGVWRWPRSRRKLSGALLAVACGGVTWLGAWLLAIFLTNGFWD